MSQSLSLNLLSVRRKVVFMAAPVLLPLRLFGPGLSAADGMTLSLLPKIGFRMGKVGLVVIGILLEHDV